MKMIQNIIITLFAIASVINAYDIASNFSFIKNEIVNKSYHLDTQTEVNGLYFRYTDKMWFFYSKKYDYLLIHETGKPTVQEGAKQYTGSKSFDSIKIANLCVSFGNNISGDNTLNPLANKTFCLRANTMSALYEKFDTNHSLWFAYFPKYDYILIHETGKPTVQEGAYQVYNASSVFGGINMPKDMFGNYLNVLEIGSETSNNSSESNNSSAGSSSSEGNNSSAGSSSSEGNNSSTGLIFPPQVPDINTSSSSSGIETPPQVPNINNQ